MRPIFLVGLAVDIPASFSLFALSDKHAVQEDESEDECADIDASATDKEDKLQYGKSQDVKFSSIGSQQTKSYGWRIPLTMFIGEVVIAIGSGMTVKYGPLFFKKDIKLSPVGVQVVYLGTMVSIALFTVLFQKLGKKIGRVQASFLARVIGLSLLTTLSFLVMNGITFWYYIATLYCVRSGLMNSVSYCIDALYSM